MNTETKEITLTTIDERTRAYTAKQRVLVDRVQDLTDEINTLKRRRLPGIKSAAIAAGEAKSALSAAIEAGSHLFEKPRTIVIDGCKVGLAKGKGKVVVEKKDEARVIARIRKLFPDRAEDLINTKETLAKSDLAKLPASDLKRLGLELAGTGDQVVIQMTDAEIQKLVDALLGEAENQEVENG